MGNNEYMPDYVSPPGDTLQELLDEQGMTQAELAQRTGRPKKTINEIVQGKAAITPETALQFERVLGTPASFWNNRERHYREFLAFQEEEDHLQQQVAWLNKIPVKKLIAAQWIEQHETPVQQLREVLRFFGVASPDRWNTLWADEAVAFRKSPAFQSDPAAVAAWLRRGEIEAQYISCAQYDKTMFRETLTHIRTLTREPTEVFQSALVQWCAQAGVAVVFVPEISGARTSGATRWLTTTKALIQLSLRHKTDDHLWFTFFHEAGHILLHSKKAIFIEDAKETDQYEQEANRFAADFLIPPKAYNPFIQARDYRSKAAIQAFADTIGIAPGIVVGRLQHDRRIDFKNCNDLKRYFTWDE